MPTEASNRTAQDGSVAAQPGKDGERDEKKRDSWNIAMGAVEKSTVKSPQRRRRWWTERARCTRRGLPLKKRQRFRWSTNSRGLGLARHRLERVEYSPSIELCVAFLYETLLSRQVVLFKSSCRQTAQTGLAEVQCDAVSKHQRLREEVDELSSKRSQIESA